VGKVILDVPSDFSCHGEDKDGQLLSHTIKTKAVEDSEIKAIKLSRNRYFLESITCLRAAVTQEVRVAPFCTSKLPDDFSIHNHRTAITKSLHPER